MQPEHTYVTDDVVDIAPARTCCLTSKMSLSLRLKAVSDEPEYDAEIAAIFTEESAELLESADKALLDLEQSNKQSSSSQWMSSSDTCIR